MNNDIDFSYVNNLIAICTDNMTPLEITELSGFNDWVELTKSWPPPTTRYFKYFIGTARDAIFVI